MEDFAQQFVNPKRKSQRRKPRSRARLHIVAERIAENPEFRKQLRERLHTEGVVRAKVVQGKESEKTKYEMYYNFEETVPKIPSHRMLAIRRGTRENVLHYSIDIDYEKSIASAYLKSFVMASPSLPLSLNAPSGIRTKGFSSRRFRTKFDLHCGNERKPKPSESLRRICERSCSLHRLDNQCDRN